MSEKKTETTNKGMKFHKLYTYVYLPLSAVIALFIALGRFYYIKTISLNSLKGWVEMVHASYPLICGVLSIIALPSLIGKTSFGRKMVLFSETLKSLLCLVLIASYLSYGNVLPAFIYTLLVFAMALVYGYYRQREWEFDPIDIESLKTATSVPPVTEEKTVVEEETVTEEEKPQEEEVVEPQEVEETPEIEEEAEEKEEITIVETTGDYDESDTVKITSILSATFVPDSPILVDETTIRTQKENSLVSIKVRNISDKTFTSSTWVMDGIREFKSNAVINPFSETTINASLSVPTDRATFRLSSLEELGGATTNLKGKKQIARPDKLSINTLSSEESFSLFLSELKEKEGVDAKWLYTEDETSSSWLCPQCGIPVSNEENNCPLCKLEKEKAKIFSPSSLSLLFENNKED